MAGKISGTLGRCYTRGVRQLSEETRNKLHPALLRALEPLHLLQFGIIRDSELESVWTELVHKLDAVRTEFIDMENPAPEGSIAAKKAEIETSKAVAVVTRYADGFFRTPNLRTAQGVSEKFYQIAPRKAQIFTNRARHALKSPRSNRKGLAPYKKAVHNYIFMLLSVFGALRNVPSQVYEPVSLTSAELKEIFGYVCPTCLDHSSKTLERSVERLAAQRRSKPNEPPASPR